MPGRVPRAAAGRRPGEERAPYSLRYLILLTIVYWLYSHTACKQLTHAAACLLHYYRLLYSHTAYGQLTQPRAACLLHSCLLARGARVRRDTHRAQDAACKRAAPAGRRGDVRCARSAWRGQFQCVVASARAIVRVTPRVITYPRVWHTSGQSVKVR